MAPLDHVRVVDATGYLAGPFAAMMLADLGADVVKVERPPKGDPLRTIGHRFRGHSVQSDNVNRNKRSVLLDLRDTGGRDAFLHLIADADVVMSSWRPGVAEALGLGDDALVCVNPRLVRVWITGFGPSGFLADRPAPRSFVMATADGWLAVAPATGGQVQAALRAVGHPEWMDAVRAVTDPIALIAALLDRLESVTVTAPTAVWLERFGAADVPVAEVLAPDAHLADRQVIHNGVYGEVDHPVRGRMRYVRYPARFASDPGFVLRRPAPSAGQHTEEVLAHAPR